MYLGWKWTMITPFLASLGLVYCIMDNWLIPKCDLFNFEFNFLCLGLLVLTFTKFMLSNIIWLYSNVHKEPWIYLWCTQISWAHFSFQTILLFGFINHPNKYWKWILCINLFHNIYDLSLKEIICQIKFSLSHISGQHHGKI
jgi:hypothetical protein